MAQYNHTTDVNNQEQAIEALPAGSYPMMIVESSYENNNKGVPVLKFTWEVIDGPFKGRKVFENLCPQHPTSQQAREISTRTLNTINSLCGIEQLQDTTQLHGIPMMVKVNFKQDDEYGDKNEVKKHSPMEEAPIPAHQGQTPESITQQQSQVTSSVETPVSQKKQPWEK